MLVAAGLAVLITTRAGVLTAVTLIGGAYLIGLGSSVVSRPREADGARRPPRVESPVRVAARGAATSGLNPKGLLLFVAVLPQFVERGGGLPVSVQIGALGAIHVINCAVAYLALGLLARNLLSTHPSIASTVSRAAGVAMIVVGGLLVLERALAA